MEKLNVKIGTKFKHNHPDSNDIYTIESLKNNNLVTISWKGETAVCLISDANKLFNNGTWIEVPQPEPLDLTKILKAGDRVYALHCGDVEIMEIQSSVDYQIAIENDNEWGYLMKDGKMHEEGECLIFPSKENRDWSTWKREEFKKGDSILVWDKSDERKYQSIFYEYTETGILDGMLDKNYNLLPGINWRNCELYDPSKIKI